MRRSVLPFVVLLALAPTASAEVARIDRVELAQFTIHQRIVIRIPRVLGGRRDQRSEPREMRWAEKKGPKCVPLDTLAGAVITGTDRVDLLLTDDTRLRAEFEGKCPALDFYSGLYIKGTSDGLVCADRDAIRARSGSTCQIDRFKRLVAKR